MTGRMTIETLTLLCQEEFLGIRQQFKEVHDRFETVDRRLDGVEQRLDFCATKADLHVLRDNLTAGFNVVVKTLREEIRGLTYGREIDNLREQVRRLNEKVELE